MNNQQGPFEKEIFPRFSQSVQAAETKYYRPCGSKKIFIFHSFGEGKIQVQDADRFCNLVRALFLLCTWPPSCFVLIWGERGRKREREMI